MELFVARGGIEPPYIQSSNPYLNKLGFLYYVCSTPLFYNYLLNYSASSTCMCKSGKLLFKYST